MVIGIDASRANAENRTGTEWYSFHVIQELKTLIPAEHRVILYSKEPLRDDFGDLPAHWESRVLRWPPKFMWTQLRLSVQMIFARPDVLYVPAHTIPLIHPKRTVTVLHDVGFERQDELYNDAQIGYNSAFMKRVLNFAVRIVTLGRYSAREQDYHRFSARFALRSAAHIITVSEFTKKEIRDVYPEYEHAHISVIHNGFNNQKNITDDTRVKQYLQEQGIEKPYMYFLGRLEQKKNVPRLIDAFAVLRTEHGFEGQLVLAGSPGFQYEEIQRRIAEHGLQDVVQEPGWVSDEESRVLLQEASAFVFPSLYEGFGIPVLEAMDAGVPVVCSAIPALQEVADDAALYFNPEDVNDMALQMHQALTNNEQREQLKQAGSARVQQFSWRNTAEDTWKILQNV